MNLVFTFNTGTPPTNSYMHDLSSPDGEWHLPVQFLSRASRAKPLSQEQWKLPTELRQVPCVHRPGNTWHSFTSGVRVGNKVR